jgi:hypothetical protein
VYTARTRTCDLGYLRNAYQRPDGTVGWRCPAERENAYLSKGGNSEDLAGRKCLCAALSAAVGLGAAGEPSLITAGLSVRQLLAYLPPGRDSYCAKDVISRILGNTTTSDFFGYA